MSPEALIQAQLDAYNAKDLDRLMHTYAPDAQLFTLHGELLASGHEAIRERFTTRFQDPDLRASLLSRLVVGNVVADHESITQNFTEGTGTIEMLCIYEVVDGKIRNASFSVGHKQIVSR